MNPAVAEPILEQEFFQIGSPDDPHKAVRQNIAYGADFIKVVADADGRFIRPEEMIAIVDEAHRSKLKVAVLATTVTGIQTAVDPHVDWIEHGNEITDGQLKAMKQSGIFLDITQAFYGGRYRTLLKRTIVLPPDIEQDLQNYEKIEAKDTPALIQRIFKSGVKYAAGSDMWYDYPGKTRGQATATMYGALHDLQLSTADILRATTVNAAELIGWHDRVGTLEPGKFADIVATCGDPLEDITELERVRFVMKEGAVIRNDLQTK